jgi:prolyl-tRNA synthetase
LLEQIQKNLFQKALDLRTQKTYKVDTWSDFLVQIEKGGFLMAHWDGTPETEQKIKDETKATIRLIPLDGASESGKCIYSGNPSNRRVYFARAY